MRIVAPSSPFPRDAFDHGVARLRERYEVRNEEAIFARDGFLAGDDDRRLAELVAALEEPDSHAIVAARGGYGMTRILTRLRPSQLSRARKLIVGFSDLTALHALARTAGLRSVHGAMVCGLAIEGAAFDAWVALVEGAVPAPIDALTTIAPGIAEGTLAGGNLATLVSLLGTETFPDLAGAILFLEDTGEKPYRVDRMLTQLIASGSLSGVAGVILGAFTEAKPNADEVRVEDVLAERLASVGKPVAGGVRAGHVDDNVPLPLGARVTLDAGRGTLTFHEGATE